jgi:hypothetical protein
MTVKQQVEITGRWTTVRAYTYRSFVLKYLHYDIINFVDLITLLHVPISAMVRCDSLIQISGLSVGLGLALLFLP